MNRLDQIAEIIENALSSEDEIADFERTDERTIVLVMIDGEEFIINIEG